MTPYLIKTINSMTMPTSHFNGGYLSNVKFALAKTEASQIDIGMEKDINAVTLSATSIGGYMTGKVHYSFMFLNVDTNFYININDGAAIYAAMSIS